MSDTHDVHETRHTDHTSGTSDSDGRSGVGHGLDPVVFADVLLPVTQE